MNNALTIALSKGRIFEETLPLLAAAGVELGKTYPRPQISPAAGRDQALAAYASIKGGSVNS